MHMHPLSPRNPFSSRVLPTLVCHAAGHILYHGPRTEVMDFFRSLGFDLPKRKGIPDFLQEVSGKKDQAVCPLCLRATALDSAMLVVSKFASVCFDTQRGPKMRVFSNCPNFYSPSARAPVRHFGSQRHVNR